MMLGFLAKVAGAAVKVVVTAVKVAASAVGGVIQAGKWVVGKAASAVRSVTEWGRTALSKMKTAALSVAKNIAVAARQAYEALPPHVRQMLEDAKAWVLEQMDKTFLDHLLGRDSGPKLVKYLTELATRLEQKSQELVDDDIPLDFDTYARLRVAADLMRSLINRLVGAKRPEVLDDVQRSGIYALHSLIVTGDIPEEEAWASLDELCRQEFGKALLELATQQVFTLWTLESEELEDKLVELVGQRHELSTLVARLEAQERVEGTLSPEDQAAKHEALQKLKLLEPVEETLRLQYDDLRIVANCAEGVLLAALGHEDDPILLMQVEPVKAALAQWRLNRQLTQEQRELLAAFGVAYQRRAKQRAEGVRDDLDGGAVSIGV